MNRREILKAGAGALSMTAALPHLASAQSKYPDRPVKLVIPFAPGGVTDIVGRHWAERMKGPLGTVYVENMGGAAGSIGASEVARSAPDGHTIVLGNTSVVVLNPLTRPKLSYDPAKDFAPISILCVASVAIVVNASLPIKTLKELVEYVKANNGKVSYGSAGAGTMTHLAAELFKQKAGLADLNHVPYKGAGPAIADVVSGHVQIATPNITNQVLELHKTEKLRILAVMSNERLKGAPDVPTVIELGYPDTVGQLFVGVLVPAATPKAVIDQLAAANAKVMSDPEFQRILIASGLEPVSDTPERAKTYLVEETARWTPVLNSIGMVK